MAIAKELSNREFLQSEYNYHHSSYQKELEFYAAVCSGDEELVAKLFTPIGIESHGKLSRDPLTNVKYHLVITIAMLTRFCIESGMNPEKAFTISDIYIGKMDDCRSVKSVHELHHESVMYYLRECKKMASKTAYSKHILIAIDYIYENIYSGVTIQEIATELKITPQYLSKLFKNEVGMNISEYIMSKRIEAAENMLRYSEYSPLDIGNYLSFSSHSHFISAFKKKTGLTPRQYREIHFRSKWG
ncbi:MAG: helix-turn-helix domain-containing protein [Ruminococcus sp.]|nr:helix-turn-helix domain-containing protein [Ruminococcus sp.]